MLIEGAVERDDVLRFVFGALALAVGLYMVGLSTILWSRSKKEKRIEPAISENP
jgi:hypothetical protein